MKKIRVQFGLRGIFLFVFVVAVASPWWLAFYEELAARNQFVPVNVKEWARVSPFTSLSMTGDEITVEFDEKEYRLVSIDGISTSRLYRIAELQFGESDAHDRLIEDLAEVLQATGKDPDSRTVDLVLIDRSTGERKTVQDAAMTSENRSATMLSRIEQLRQESSRGGR